MVLNYLVRVFLCSRGLQTFHVRRHFRLSSIYKYVHLNDAFALKSFKKFTAVFDAKEKIENGKMEFEQDENLKSIRNNNNNSTHIQNQVQTKIGKTKLQTDQII